MSSGSKAVFPRTGDEEVYRLEELRSIQIVLLIAFDVPEPGFDSIEL